jgi:hypothetical protein
VFAAADRCPCSFCWAWSRARQTGVFRRELHRHLLQIWPLPNPAAVHPRCLVPLKIKPICLPKISSRLVPLRPSLITISPAGREGSGIVVSAPSDSGFHSGDRVACLTPGNASYAQFVAVPSSNCVKVPDSVPSNTACAALLQGLTAIVLTRRVYPVATGETVLVHAAAGGTGSLILQACRAAGATGALLLIVIQTSSSRGRAPPPPTPSTLQPPSSSDRHVIIPRETGSGGCRRRAPLHFLRRLPRHSQANHR